MDEFVKLAFNVCKKHSKNPDGLTLTQPNWIRFMLGLPLLKTSQIVNSSKESKDDDFYSDNGLKKKDAQVARQGDLQTKCDKSIIESFLKSWFKKNKKETVIPCIKKALLNEQLEEEKYEIYKDYIISWVLIDCNIHKLLLYKSNTDQQWKAYFCDYIRTIIREMNGIKPVRGITKSSFYYNLKLNEPVKLFSKNADVSCIVDKSVNVKLINKGKKKVLKTVALKPKAGLTYKFDIEDSIKGESLEVCMEIKNFRTGNGDIAAFAYEFQSAQFISAKLFKDCTHLSIVKLSDNVKVVGKECFAGCTSLRKLEMPELYVIIGECDYNFEIRHRNPIAKIKPFTKIEEMGCVRASGDYSEVNNTSNPDASDNGVDIDSFDVKYYKGGGDSYVDDDEDNNDVPFDMRDEHLQSSELDDAKADIKFCLQMMPNKLRSDILKYTHWGIPNAPFEVRYDKKGYVKIESVRRYMINVLHENPRHNYDMEKNRGNKDLMRLYIVYTTLKEWKSSNNEKIKAVNSQFANETVFERRDVLIRIFRGETYTQIANILGRNEEEIRNDFNIAFNRLYRILQNIK